MKSIVATVLALVMLCMAFSACDAQFGLGRRREVQKQEPTDFEKAQARAATGGQGKAAAAAAGAAGMNDVESLMAGLTPQERKEVEKMMEQMGDVDPTKMMGDMQKAMGELAKLSPEDLSAAMAEVMESPEMQAMLNDPASMLEQMRGSGMVADEVLDEYIKNPAKYEKELEKMTQEIKNVLSDPKTMNEMMGMMKEVTDVLADPKKLEEAMMDIAKEMEEWETTLSDDDKIEEARLKLLDSPDLSSNPKVAGVFNTKEMKEIINDPVKWRENLKKGRDIMKGGAARKGAAARKGGAAADL